MDFVLILGLFAGALTTGSTIPQIHKILKTKSAVDISTLFFLFMGCGMLLWLIYGILRSDLIIILWNSLSLSLCFIILGLKKVYP
ncbi:SemiSWEET family sugar transporter [Methanocella sp. MCL-LM]|uniref:SemiSWEET family sugar transporter n=1 Tax=Methanocella sp. MCL-LM TaxID=3412035 RepID=UPI003C709A0F